MNKLTITEKDLRLLMILTDISQVSIARICKVPRSYVHQELTEERNFPKIRRAIALAIIKSVKRMLGPRGNGCSLANNKNIKKKTSRQGKKIKRSQSIRDRK